MRHALAALGIAAVLTLSGCAATDGYPDATAQSMQEAVLAVTQASSTGEWTEAQLALDEAADRLANAVSAGEISEERAAEIAAAIAEVRADLDALIAAELLEQDTDGDDDGNNGNGNDDKDKDKDKNGKDD